MGCTARAGYMYKTNPQVKDRNLPTTMHSGSEIITIKQNRQQTIKNRNSDCIVDAPSAIVIEKAQLPKDFEYLLQIMHKHFLFKTLDDEIKAQTIRSMKYFKLGPKQVVFTQGHIGGYLFIIVKGEVQILVNDQLVKTVAKGNIIGEVAVIHTSPRTASALTVGNVELWGLDRDLFKSATQVIAAKQFHENKTLLDKCELFAILDPTSKNKLLEVAVSQIFCSTVIIREGEPGEHLYIIKSGKVKLEIPNECEKELSEGGYFGEQSFLNEDIRTATVTAIDSVTLISFGRNDLERILGSNYMKIIYQNCQKISLQQDTIFKHLTQSQITLITNWSKIKKYKDSDVVIKENKILKKVIMIIRGALVNNNQEFNKYKCIGSEAMIDTNFCCGKYLAKGRVECAEISRAKIEELLKGTIDLIVQQNQLINILQNLPIFNTLNENTLREITAHMKSEQYEDTQVIFSQHSIGNELYIIHTGEVVISIDGKYVRTLVSGSFFGERALVFNEPRSASAISKGKSSVFILTRSMFESILDEKIREHIEYSISLQDNSIELEDLSLIRLIGKGMFGNVFLSVNRRTSVKYAIKTISYYDIKRLKIQKNIKSSEKVLLQISCPLIMKLIKTLSDSDRVYFILEYIPGISLYKILEDTRVFPVSQLIFYLANMTVILKHLHTRNIIHRDIKPENLIVDKKGYLRLIDFDTAIKAKDRCYTVAGTPHYMAPEMLKANGYGVSVDIWSLGVMMYEIIYGVLPFAQYSDDPLEIYQEIIEARVEYRNKYKAYQGMLEAMLNPNPGLRIDWKKLMELEMLKPINWDLISQRKVIPSFIPVINEKEEVDELPEFSTGIIIEQEMMRLNAKSS